MSPAEKSLYDDVTQYLLEPGILAFEGRQRQLLLLGFHRRMASSTRALAASLRGVATRLRRMLGASRRPVRRTRTRKRCSPISKRTMPVPTIRLRSTTGAHRQAPRKSRPSWPASKASSSAPRRSVPTTASSARCCRRSASSWSARDRQRARSSSSRSRSVTQAYLRERLVESRLVRDDRDHALLRHERGPPRARGARALARGECHTTPAGSSSPTSRRDSRSSTSSRRARASSSPPRPAPRA